MPAPTPALPPINKSLLVQEDYRYFAMLPVFATGIVRFAGGDPAQVGRSMLAAGMNTVFQWWCSDGIPLPGEPDFRDVAAQVAAAVAEELGFEPAEIQSAINTLKNKWMNYPCTPPPTLGRQSGSSRPSGPSRSARSRSRRR